MDLDVNLDLNASPADTEVQAALRTFRVNSASSHASGSVIDFSPSNSSLSSTETKRSQRRLSATPSSFKQTEVMVTTVKEGTESKIPSQAPTRKRRSRVSLQEGMTPEVFPKPSSSSRPRHSIARRFSPTPESRPKLKSIAALLQSKAKDEKNKMELYLSQLPTCCDATSRILLECVINRDAMDFVLHEQPEASEVEPDKDVVTISATSASTSNAPVVPSKQEVENVESSDDEEEEDNNAVPFVRMADIGAAPFSASPSTPVPAPSPVKSRKRPRSSLPIIKLPRRRTLGGMNKVESADSATQPLLSKRKSSSGAEIPSTNKTERVVIEVKSPPQIVKDVSLEVSPTEKSERSMLEVKSTDYSDKDISELPKKKARRGNVGGSRAKVEKKVVLADGDQIPDVTVQIQSPPKKRMKETESSSVQDRPKRATAGKTLSFLADVTKRRKRSTRKSDPPNADTKDKSDTPSTDTNDKDVQSCSTSSTPRASGRSLSLDAGIGSTINYPPKSVSSSSRRVSVSRSSKRALSVEDESLIMQEEMSEAQSSETSSEYQLSTRPSSAASTDEIPATEGLDPSRVESALSSGRGRGRGRRRTSFMRGRGMRRPKMSLGAERTSPLPPARPSPALLNVVRRSSRGRVITNKARDPEQTEQQSTSHDAWKQAKHVNPNSALGILQRVSRYTRPIRSPSPQPSTASLSKREQVTESSILPVATLSDEVKPEDAGAKMPSPAAKQDVTFPTTLKEENDFLSDTSKEHGEGSVKLSETLVSDPQESLEVKNEGRPDVAQASLSPTHAASAEAVDVPTSSDEVRKDVEKRPEEVKDSEKAKAASVLISPSAQAGRISSRAVRPSSRFLNADFVSPLRKRRGRRPRVSSQEIATNKPSESVDTVGGSEVLSEKTDPPAEQQNIHPASVPTETSSLRKSKTILAGRSHVMKTRRASDEQPRIKLKIKLGRTPWIKILGNNNDAKTEVVSTSEQVPVKQKAPQKRYISPWSHYVPSVKPVLGNVYYSDGTVEKLGVSVNAVMDRLLAEVCQDGITRHSAIINKREKRKRNIEKARERVHRLKEERAARIAQGYAVASTKTTSFQPSLQDESAPRARNVKHRLMQKDFLYPSLKRGTKTEKRKNEELRRQRSRNVMNQLAESTREKETAPTSRRGSATAAKIRPRVPSPFDPEKEERLRREAEQREKQKRLTMPISFNTFLSSKTSVLTAQPLLQPQRSNDRSTAPDHFYRELLCESSIAVEPAEDTWNEFDMDGDDGPDVTTIEAVHIPKLDDYVAPPELDESAEPVAATVEQMLMRPTIYVEEDGISYLHERALEQPELRRTLLAMAIDCISALHVARLSASGREAAVVVYNAVTTQASKMRDVFCMFSREREEAVFWLHRYLIEMLPVELLASYLFLLRHTRLLNCQVKSIVRSTQNDSNPWPEITHIIIKYIEVNVVEPDAADLDRTIASTSLPDVIFVLVAPNITVGDFSVRDRHYDSIFKWLRDIGNPASTLVRLKIDESFSTAISEMFSTGVNMISRVITKLVREHKQKRIVLVGWGTSCCFNHVVLNTVPGVSAIIDLAFPVLTIDGMRGEPDDDILLTYCPTLFVVGSESCDYHPGAMKYMRSNMIMPTGLVVIGHANNNLAVSCSALSRLRITQKVVNRCIVEQICDFLSMDWTKRERSRLVPMPLNDTFKIDLMQLRIDEKAAQANKKPKEDITFDNRSRKKKLSGTPLPSPIPREASPSPLPLTLDSMRSNFQNLLKKAGTEKPSKWPEDRSLLSSAFKEPRLPSKPGSAMASPLPARTESPNLLDPASISLT